MKTASEQPERVAEASDSLPASGSAVGCDDWLARLPTTMRKLDAWIAENIFGYRWGHYGHVDDKTGLPEIGWREWIYLSEPERFSMPSWHPMPREKVDAWINKGVDSYPNYTTDAAAAIEVLKYCMKHLDRLTGRTDFQIVTLYDEGNKSPYVVVTDSQHDADDPIHVANCASAETLELAICRFARKLCGANERANDQALRPPGGERGAHKNP